MIITANVHVYAFGSNKNTNTLTLTNMIPISTEIYHGQLGLNDTKGRTNIIAISMRGPHSLELNLDSQVYSFDHDN